jgi:hypothetical protein
VVGEGDVALVAQLVGPLDDGGEDRGVGRWRGEELEGVDPGCEGDRRLFDGGVAPQFPSKSLSSSAAL